MADLVVGQMSEEEIKQLPRLAMVALAARCAMRVSPMYGGDSALVGVITRSSIEAIDNCAMLAALVSVQKYPANPREAALALVAAADSAAMGVFSISSKAASAAECAARAAQSTFVIGDELIDCIRPRPPSWEASTRPNSSRRPVQ